MTRPLTPEERSLMEHALGRGSRAKDARNHFAVGKDSPDFAVWEQLVADGFAKRGREISWTGGLVYFHVTEDGKEALDGDA